MGVRWDLCRAAAAGSDGCQMKFRYVSDGCQIEVRWHSEVCKAGVRLFSDVACAGPQGLSH